MSDFWHIWAVLNLFSPSLWGMQSFDKESTDKTFQVDRALPPFPGANRWVTSSSLYFKANQLRQLWIYVIRQFCVILSFLFLPSNGRVRLMNQRDRKIQSVVREFVFWIGTANKVTF